MNYITVRGSFTGAFLRFAIIASISTALLLNPCGPYLQMVSAKSMSLVPLDAVSSLSMSDDMQYVACARDDCQVFVWQLHPVRLVGFYDANPNNLDHVGSIASINFSANKKAFTVATDNGATMAFSIRDGKTLYHQGSVSLTPDSMRIVQLFQSGQRLAVGTATGTITTMTSSDHGNSLSWRLPRSGLLEGSISPNGRLLAALDLSGEVLLLDTRSQKVIATTSRGNISNGFCYFSENERECVLSNGEGGQILFWSRKLGHSFQKIGIPDVANTKITLSPDGRLLAISDQTSFATIWGIDSKGAVKRHIYTLGNLNQPRMFDTAHITTAMTFSPDNNTLLLGDRDGSVVMWDFKKGTHIILRGNEPRL